MESKLNFDFKTTQEIIKSIGFIDAFKGKWIGLEEKESRYLKELKMLATVESIGSSTRIEGATLTNEEVADLLNQVKITSLKTREEQEVMGYYEALNTILDAYEDIEIKESHIHHLHKQLLQFSTKDESHRGQYKQLSNKVVANYPDGSQRVIFNTTQPFLVKTEMGNLISWANQNFEKKEIHPLIVIGTFVYEFLSIHPYQDGNGRLSRLLTTLLLLKNDYDFMQYASMEIEIEKQKKAYYNALMKAQLHRGTNKEILDQWMLFFLQMLEKAIQQLETRYAEIKGKKSYLNDRQKVIMAFIQEHEPVKMPDILAEIKTFTHSSIKKDVKYFVSEGLVKQIGKGRATIYIVNERKLAN